MQYVPLIVCGSSNVYLETDVGLDKPEVRFYINSEGFPSVERMLI